MYMVWVGGLTRRPTTSRPDTLWPEIKKDMSADASKRTEKKQKWATEKPETRECMKIAWYFLHWTWWWQMPVESGKLRCQQRCFADLNVTSKGELVAQLKNTRQNMPVLLKPTNRWGNAWKDLKARTMKTTFLEKAWIRWVTTIMCTNLILCLKQWKIQMQRQQWRKNEKSRENHSMLADESQNKSEVIAEARNKIREVHFLSRGSPVISRMWSWNRSFKNTKAELCSEVILWKMAQTLTQ